MTKNCWCCVDALFQHGAQSVLLLLLSWRQPIPHLSRFATNRHWSYPTCKAKNRWCSIDAHFNVLSIPYLLPLIIAFIIIWTYWLPFWLIETWPFGKVEPSNILALVALILLKSIHLAKWFILPAVFLCINQYSHLTAQYSPIIFLYMLFSVKQHQNLTLTHSVLLSLVPLIPPHFHCIGHHQHLCSHVLWPPCWPNPSGNILCSTNIPLLWAFRILNAIV